MELEAQGLANMAWAFATAGLLDQPLFAALAGAAERRLCEFDAEGLANLAWAFAKAGQSDQALFLALAKVLGD